jgi:hypothetical protein
MSIEAIPNAQDRIAYVALDPGETTGWAVFDEFGSLITMGQFKLDQQTEILTELISNTPNLKVVICEDYRNHGFAGARAQKRWSRNQTSKNIGKIELLAELRNVPYVLQQNTVKAVGYAWGGLDGPPSNHSISHQYDAYAHGIYWLQSNGVREPGRVIFQQEK